MVNVIGLGYIGLPTALMLASHGVEVVGTDLNASLVAKLSAGELTFKEQGLEQVFRDALAGNIRFTTECQEAEAYVISVPTPYDSKTKRADACFVVAAVSQVLKKAPEDALIVIESTISPGTIDKEVRPLVGDAPVHLAHAPERIIPGNMVHELLHNDRTLGADSPEQALRAKEIYASFCQGEITLTDIKTAEMTKVVENAYRAVNIAFANELSRICRHDGMDVFQVISICNRHPRVNILNPGPGVGGHCIAVDPWFLVGDYPGLTNVIAASMGTNATQPLFVLKRIRQIMQEHGISDSRRVGLYGITYKENVDDFRDSPTLQMLAYQEDCMAEPLRCYDPFLSHRRVTPSQVFDFDEFLDASDLVVIVVRHDHLARHWDKLRGKTILDCHHFCPLEGTIRL